MTLQAKKWNLDGQQVAVYRAVGLVTCPAVFHILRMFEYERTLLFSVALGACLFDRIFSEHLLIG